MKPSFASIEKTGSDLLRQLLIGVDIGNGRCWGMKIEDDHDRLQICSGLGHLIESIAWLGCQDELSNHLRGCDRILLRKKTFRNPDELAFNASRLKAAILLGEIVEQPIDYQAVLSALKYLSKTDVSRTFVGDFERYCLCDLSGTVLSLKNKPSRIRSLIKNDDELHNRIRTFHAELLEHILEHKTDALLQVQKKSKAENPKGLSFALWLLLIGGKYDRTECKGVESDEFRTDLEGLIAATKIYDKSHNLLGRFNRKRFTHFVFPKLILAWNVRKGRIDLNLDKFSSWLVVQSSMILAAETFDPLKAAVCLKYCIAARKPQVRTEFRKRLFETSIEANRETVLRRSDLSKQFLERVLRAALNIRIDTTERLTGGWSSAHVWRVGGTIASPLSGNHVTTDGRSEAGGKFSIVVKTGEKSYFLESARKFTSLSAEAQKIFVQHDPNTSFVEFEGKPIHFVVMEELGGYRSLGKLILEELPADSTVALDLERIGALFEKGIQTIRRLHSVEPIESTFEMEPLESRIRTGHLYSFFSEFSQNWPDLQRLIRSEVKLVEKNWLDRRALAPAAEIARGIVHNVGRVVAKPKKRSDRMRMTHGDCHSHNIMIRDVGDSDGVFIDIDGLAIDDFLLDYADFVAHVCFSLGLEKLAEGDVELELRRDNEITEVSVDFELPRYSEIARDYFDWTVKLLKEEYRDDPRVLSRFYLYLGRRLAYVASKSREKEKAVVLLFQGLAILEALRRWEGGDQKGAMMTVPWSYIRLIFD